MCKRRTTLLTAGLPLTIIFNNSIFFINAQSTSCSVKTYNSSSSVVFLKKEFTALR